MNYLIDDNLIFVNLDPGDSIMEELTLIAVKNKIESGWISGIGAIRDPEVGMYYLINKVYEKKIFKGNYELLSFQGNISIKDNKQFIHAHIIFSDSEYNSFGGHLFQTCISVAGEFIIHKGNKNLNRKYNREVGLPLWCIKK